MSILTDDEILSINMKYKQKNTDIHLQKMYDNLEKISPWKSVKNNNKTNKLKKKNIIKEYKPDPYKFLKIPTNMREIIVKLCKKHDISLQILAVKTGLKLYILYKYINNKHPIDNYHLHIIVKYFNFDLVDYINKSYEENK